MSPIDRATEYMKDMHRRTHSRGKRNRRSKRKTSELQEAGQIPIIVKKGLSLRYSSNQIYEQNFEPKAIFSKVSDSRNNAQQSFDYFSSSKTHDPEEAQLNNLERDYAVMSRHDRDRTGENSTLMRFSRVKNNAAAIFSTVL